MPVRCVAKDVSENTNLWPVRSSRRRQAALCVLFALVVGHAGAQVSDDTGSTLGDEDDVPLIGLSAPDAGPPAPAANGSLEPMPQEQFDLQVRGLEERVTDLKEKIFQTKARLLLLQETVIGGDLSTGARASIVHRNDMGASFVLESLTYILDGAPIFTRVDPTGELDRQKEIEVFNGRIVPGMHQIGVRLVYRGSGYGVFSYLNDYRFRVQSSYTFNAEGGKATRVTVVGFERGGFTSELQDRPGVRYEEEVTREIPGTTSHTVELEGSP